MSTFKNKLLKLFMTGMLVLTSFAFLSCGGNGAGGGSGGGADGSGGETPFTGLTAEQKAKLDSLNGWELTISHKWSDSGEENPDEETWTIGEKNNIFWSEMGYEKLVLKKENGTVIPYRWDDDTDGYIVDPSYGVEGATLTEDYYDKLTMTSYMWIFWKDMYNGMELTNAGSATICNRACTKYSWTDSAAAFGQWATAHITFWVDNATGITMKLEAGNASNDGSASYVHEVTSFKTGSDVTPPTLN